MKQYQSILKRRAILAGLGIVLMIMSALPAGAQMAGEQSYCSTPPFLASSNAQPNVMIMLDNSGSMADHPFSTTFDPTQFASGYYFGYFDPTKMYQYDSAAKMWRIYTGPLDPVGYSDSTQPIASGNLLNWAATRKLEVAKKLLVGGNPGVVGGVVNPRKVTAPATIKLYSEDEGSSNPVSFDNTDIASLPSYTYYLVPGYSNVLYGLSPDNYTYKLGSGGCSGSPGCSKLSISAGSSSSDRYYSSPYMSDIPPTVNNWTKYPSPFTTHSWPCNDDSSYRCTVRDEDASSNPVNRDDGDNSYIQNRRDTYPMEFGLNASSFTAGSSSGRIIQDVNVVVVARMVAQSSGDCNASKHGSSIVTRKIQAVLQLTSGATATVFPSTTTNLNNSSRNWDNYATYTFTWPVNPSTGAAWTWDDVMSSGTSTNWLTGFGVQNGDAIFNGSSNQTCYARYTQVYVFVDATTPSGTYSLVVDTGKQSITGMLDTLATGARFGLGTYGPSSNGGQVLVPVDFSNIEDKAGVPGIATQVIKMSATNSTPLAESEYELLNYYRQVNPLFASTANAYTPGSFSAKDPYYFMYSHLTSHGTSTHDDQYVPCAKSYILLMTDGEPTADNFKNASGGNVSMPTGFTTNRFDTSSYLDDLALWGRTADMRPGSCSGLSSTWTFPCIPSPPTQNVVTYPIFLFGKGLTLLQSAAINGGFTGLPVGGLPPCLDPTDPTKLKPGVTQIELKACFRFAADNTSGILNPIAPWGTGDDPPITYYEGSDAYELQSSLTAAISDMMKRSASGTAVSVLTTSSRGVGSMLQAYFLPIRQEGLRQVTWTGYAQNIWLYDELREDSQPDKQLIMSQDDVIKMYLDPTSNETMAGRFTTDDQGQGGTLASCTTTTNVPFSDINYLWEAGQKLALMRPSRRTIITAKNVIRGTTTTDTFATNDFTVSNITSDATLNAALNPDAVYSTENIVRYVRGECLESNDGSGDPVTGDNPCTSTANSTYRDRRVTVLDKSSQNVGDASGNVWKLGDIIASTPQVLGTKPISAYYDYYSDNSYYSFTHTTAFLHRSSIAFIGANDGMLHAFRVGYLKPQDPSMASSLPPVWALFKNAYGDSAVDKLGEEVWAYIPFNAFPYLKYLADPDYCHIYFNDMPVNLFDASLGGASNPNPTDAKTADSWKTILIGSMRFGGGCAGADASPNGAPAGTPADVGYSAYYAIDVTDAENPKPLWEFTDPDLGYATSYPGIVRTGDASPDHQSLNGHWYAVFGSGSKVLPTNTSDIGRTTPGYVYVLDLKTGALVKKILLDNNHIVGDVLVVDANKDYLSEKVYLGTAYNSSGWKGKLISIDIPNQDLSVSWTPTVHYLFSGNYPFTAKPDAGLDSNLDTWVFAGSGKYYSNVDQADNSQQVFLGFKDKGILSPLTVGNLNNRTSTTTTGAVKSTTKVCMYDPTIDSTSGLPVGFGLKDVVTAVSSTIVTAPSTTGWYINLAVTPAGERVISRPTVFGGLVDFLSYIPNGDPCNAGGNSYLYSVGFSTGVAPSTVSIYNPGATSGTSGNVTVYKGVLMGPGTPPTGESIILTPKTGNKNTLSKKVQVSTGVIVELTDNPPMDTTSRILHWLRK